jgi:hypothetical protein
MPDKKINKTPPNIKNKILGICLFVAGVVLGLGLPMIIEYEFAPWFLSIGVLAVAIIIIFDDYVRYIFEKHIRQKSIRILICIILLLLCIPTFLITQNSVDNRKEIIAETPSFVGIITPENESTKSDTTLILGNVLVKVSHIENYVLATSSIPFLSLELTPNGYLKLSANVCDSANNNVVKIKNNIFRIYQNRAFWPIQPDSHTLIIVDSEDIEVLKVQFIDTKTIYMTGIFYIEGYSEPFKISDNDGISYPGGGMNTCFLDMTNYTGKGFINFNKNTVSIGSQ